MRASTIWRWLNATRSKKSRLFPPKPLDSALPRDLISLRFSKFRERTRFWDKRPTDAIYAQMQFPLGSWLIRITLLIGVLSSLPVAVLAQMDQGTITGTVLDNTGAAVPGAAVSLTSVDTGLTLNSTTDGSGGYTFSPVKIGNYKLSAKAGGFSIAVQDNVHLSIQQRLEVNLQLKPGTATQTVEVTSAPPCSRPKRAPPDRSSTPTTINDTPLNGRNWVFIAQLTAGVAPPNGARGAG